MRHRFRNIGGGRENTTFGQAYPRQELIASSNSRDGKPAFADHSHLALLEKSANGYDANRLISKQYRKRV